MPKGLYELRDKHLLSIDMDRVRKIEWDYGGKRIVCVRAGKEEWKIEEPVKLKADFFAVNDILWSLKDARIKEFFDHDPGALKGDEFNRINLRLGFWEDGKEEGRWLILGKEDNERDGVFVRIEGDRQIYLVDKKLKIDLTKTPFDLRDKSLFSFEREEIFRLQATMADRKYVIERSGQKWKILEPIKAKGDPRKARALLSSIGLLKFNAIIDEMPVKDEPYGLDRASLELVLFNNEGNRLGHLRIGKEVPGKEGLVYGRTGEKSPLYGIDAKMVDEIRKELSDLVESQ